MLYRVLRRQWRCAAIAFALAPAVSSAQVRINEIVAATNDRVLMADHQGRFRPGSGPFWADPGFSAPGWLTGTAPLGYGGAAGLGTNVTALMLNRTPNLYLRRVLNLTPAQLANEGQLQLKVRFDDAFIAYLNGREVARANAGPAGHFIYANQKAYNFAVSNTNTSYTPNDQVGTAPGAPTSGITFLLGRVGDFLQLGENVLALQLINREPGTSARIDAQLDIATTTAVSDLARFSFNDANGSATVHRNLGGTVTSTAEGSLPAQSWLALAAPAQSDPGWSDLTLRSTLAPGIGYEGTGALQFSYSQGDPVNLPASFSGPVLPLRSQIPPGGLTAAELGRMNLTFRFRATANTAYSLRLDPDGNSPADSLTGLMALTPTAGTGTTQAAPDDFSDSTGAIRSRIINPTGAASNTLTGTARNTVSLFTGPLMRSATFSVLEDNTAGSGSTAAPGALQFQVVSAPATPDFTGFTYQTVSINAWSATALTATQLKAGAVQFDYRLPPGVTWSVFLEPATTAPPPTVYDRLGLGTITGNGNWRSASFDTGSATNQARFITAMNSGTNTANQVKIGFICHEALPTGSTLVVDNPGYIPWRTYNVLLSSGTNQAAFLAAVNARTAPQFVPVFVKTGTAASPSVSTVTLDDFALTYTKPNAGAAANLLPYASPGWSYFPGLAEPSGGVVEPADFNLPAGTAGYSDWIELLNEGPAPVDLSNWSLTDSRTDPARFRFPAGTLLNPGAALVVVADGRPTPAGAAWRHAPFNLASEGEYLGLYHASGTLVDALDSGYPPQNSFHSWGRDPATGTWGYLRQATPGQPNAGPWQAAQADPPAFSVPGGFYPATVTVSLTAATPGSVIRYTTDGSEPTATTGEVYTAPLNLAFISDRIGHVIRARTFGTNLLPSATVTHSYLINQHSGIRSAPAVLLSGEGGRTFYKPMGIFAIEGGSYTVDPVNPTNVWAAALTSDYNMPVGDGRLMDPASGSQPYERPAFLEYYYPDNRPGIRENAGVRVSSSPYSRPRLRIADKPNETLWAANATLKPSLNVFFRSDYGNSSIEHPLIPETAVRRFEEFRLRAGKNDISNPFIRDEFIRRLWTDMGQTGTTGTFASVYLNGYFKGYYNLVERIREPFLQSHHRSTAAWDVNYIGNFEDGDDVHWNTVLQPRLNANLTVKANWEALRQVLDVVNAADYFLLNIFSAMWDWPHNNWAMARERTSTGVWRCYVWDAEGAFNMGGKGPSWQSLRDDLLTTATTQNNTPVPVMFRRLMTSPEFRLLFADRVQKHLFHGGALTDARLSARRATTQAGVTPLMAIAGLTPDTVWFTNWTNAASGRRFHLFPNPAGTTQPVIHGMLRDPNQDGSITTDTLWPVTLPPAFSQHGGIIVPGQTLGITHTAPATSPVYYTLDGSDPRNWGGTAATGALTYTAPLVLSGAPITVKTRVRHATTNEWSSLTEARFSQATVPASAANTVIAEFMYHPPSPTPSETAAGFTEKEEFEFLVLQNIGTAPVNLTSLRFSAGLTFDFATTIRPVLDPGARCLLAKKATALRQRYGPGIDDVLGGEYSGSLKNEGEAIRLETAATSALVKAVIYAPAAPWPAPAAGRGASLRLIHPAANPDHSLPESWTASAAPGGSPTGTPLTLPYSQWAAWTFSAGELADPTLTGLMADFDNDGLPNLIEFLTGTDPCAGTTPPPLQTSIAPGSDGRQILRMTVPVMPSSAGYLLQAQSSRDLVIWQNDFTLVNATPAANGSLLQTWEKTTAPGEGIHYMRLKAVPR